MHERIRKIIGEAGVVLCVFVSGGCAGNKQASSEKKEVSVQESAKPQAHEESASLFMVGDALLHTTIDYDAQQADGSFDFTPQLHRIWDLAAPYDLRYYNQETILGGDDLGIHGYPTFNGPSAFGTQMVSHGFNLVSLANNHCLDMGETGIRNSMAFWNSQPGVVTAGTYLSQEDFDAIPVHEINGITYAFISTTYGMNGLVPPEGEEYLVDCYAGREQQVLDQIRAAKQKADVVIVAAHWGIEYQMYPSDEQQTFARQMADAGADIIIGNHPHVIQPIQRLNNHTICFYALGNLCAAQYDESRIEMMAGLTIHKHMDENGQSSVSIDDVHADLMYEYYNDATITQFETVPFAQMSDDSYLPDHQAVYDQYKGVITQMDPEVRVGGL